MCITLAEDSYRPLVRHPWPVVHNYPLVQPVESAVRAKQFIYVGDVALQRGGVEMIRAFARAELPDWTLAIVGPCLEPGTDARLREEAAQLGLGARYRRIDRVPPEAVHSLLASSSAGLAILHPTRNYVGCPPGKVFEYALAGLPAIISDFPVYRKCFGPMPSAYFVDALDVESIARTMRQIADTLPALDAVCEQSRQIVQQRYSWTSESAILQRVFADLLATDTTADARRSICAEHELPRLAA